MEKSKILDLIVQESIKGYQEISALQKAGKGDQMEIEVEMAKDRKMALALKGLMTEVHISQIEDKRKKTAFLLNKK